MAVGAQRGSILRLVLVQGLRLSALGIVFGVGLAVAGTGVLRSLLFQVEPVDPLTLAAAAALVILVTLAASYVPARRASRLDPLVALRHE
jgi:ABC-type antimicrobial peptide transport system permease subunit